MTDLKPNAFINIKNPIVVQGTADKMHKAIFAASAVDDFTSYNASAQQVCIVPIYKDDSVAYSRLYEATEAAGVRVDKSVVYLPGQDHYQQRKENVYDKLKTLIDEEHVEKYMLVCIPGQTLLFRQKALGVWSQCWLDILYGDDKQHLFEVLEPYEAVAISAGHLGGIEVTGVGCVYLQQSPVPADVARQVFVQEHRLLPITISTD